MTRSTIPLGLGIYYPAEGARLLRLKPDALRRWAQGYTYWVPRRGKRGSSRPIIQTDIPAIRGQRALSFLELMELRVVAALRVKGISLQRIRAAAQLGREALKTAHPFATRRIFTDGRTIFAQTAPPPDDDEAMIELAQDRDAQLIIADIVSPFLEELDFDAESGVASRWWPAGRRQPIVLDPRISFGAPTIKDTRIRTDAVAGVAEAESVAGAARAFALTELEVTAARDFERELRAA